MKRLFVALLILTLLGSVSYYLVTPSVESEKSLQEAYQAYKQGEEATSIEERKSSFNKALELYTDLEKRFVPRDSTGKIYYNIANSYFQLGQYSNAVLYYYRALALMPDNERVSRNLQIALAKLNIPFKSDDAVFTKIFFFHYGFSVPVRWSFFFSFSLLGLLFGSIYVWTEIAWIKKCAFLFVAIAVIFLASLGYTNYFTPLEGVIVKSTSLYRDAGQQYAKVVKEPLLSGTKVEVMDILQEGSWLKILTPDGYLGYVPQNSIEII